MRKTVEFFFDVGSPAAYLAWAQLPALCEAAGAELVSRPMLLGGLFQAIGNRSPAEVPAKGRYLMQDLRRHAVRAGLPFRMNPHFPINTLALMRAVTGVQMQAPQRLQDFCACMFSAIWVEGRAMNDPAVVAEVLGAGGFDPAEVLASSQWPEVKERLKAVTAEAQARGVFGAPTMFVGDEMFWGQDRLDFVREALRVG